MKLSLIKKIIFASAALVVAGTASAVPVTINMTGDNLINSGGLCYDNSCTDGTNWSSLGADSSNMDDWRYATSINLDLDAGTHWFAWRIENYGVGGSGNPAGLLADINWAGGSNYSSSSWEVYDIGTGGFVELATEYGENGGANIWTNVLGGAVSGISTSANWIYASENFSSNTDGSIWIRTSIQIAQVSEPGTVALLGLGLAGLGFARRKARQ